MGKFKRAFSDLGQWGHAMQADNAVIGVPPIYIDYDPPENEISRSRLNRVFGLMTQGLARFGDTSNSELHDATDLRALLRRGNMLSRGFGFVAGGMFTTLQRQVVRDTHQVRFNAFETVLDQTLRYSGEEGAVRLFPRLGNASNLAECLDAAGFRPRLLSPATVRGVVEAVVKVKYPKIAPPRVA